MKKKSERIHRVLELAETEERRECQNMGRAQKRLDDEINRLNELEAYKKSYQRKPHPESKLSSISFQNRWNFLRRLDQAVSGQKEQVLSGQQNRDAHRRRWMVTRQRIESLERVIDRYRKAEDVETERQLQKTLDDRPFKKDFFEQE